MAKSPSPVVVVCSFGWLVDHETTSAPGRHAHDPAELVEIANKEASTTDDVEAEQRAEDRGASGRLKGTWLSVRWWGSVFFFWG